MTTLETINALQIFCLIMAGIIIFMIGWLAGAHWGSRHRV
jgi:hypothetical protein